MEELAITPIQMLLNEVERRRLSASEFNLAAASTRPREFALWFEKDFFRSEKDTDAFCFAAKSRPDGKIPEEAYLYPTGYLSACPAIRVTSNEKTTPHTLSTEAAIIDCGHINDFDIRFTVTQSKKQDWARKLLKKALVCLKPAQNPTTSAATIFEKIDGDLNEKTRLIILLCHEYWDATGPKNAGKEFDLENFGVKTSNIRKKIQGMGIERVPTPAIPAVKPAKRSKASKS